MTVTITADWDGAWKESLLGLLPWFLAMFFCKAHAEIDWRRGFEPLDKELQKIAPQAASGVKRVDLLFKVWLRSGEERWLLIHIEVQAQLKARETANDRARRREWNVRLLKGLYRRGWEREDVRKLLTAIDWFLTLPRDDDRLVREAIEADERRNKCHTSRVSSG